MHKLLVTCLAVVLLGLGCASDGGGSGGGGLPTWPEWLAENGPPPAGMGRLVVYGAIRDEALSWYPIVQVDGETIGRSREFSFLVADRPPGLHTVSIGVEERAAAFGNQGATTPVSVSLAAGSTAYVQLQVEALVGMVKATLVPVDPATGSQDVQKLKLAPP